jgi:hypothetical protein
VRDAGNQGAARRKRRAAVETKWQTDVERKAAQRREERRRNRRLIRIGQVCIALAVVVAVTHLAMHLEIFGGQPSSLLDLVAGYPTAAFLGILGAILAGR